MKVYVYDGSFEGLMTCIYESYYVEKPEKIYSTISYEGNLLHESRFIVTDPEKAFKVTKAIALKLSETFFHKIVNAFFSEDYEIGNYIHELLRMGFKEGPEIIVDMTNPVVYPVLKLANAVSRETHLLVGLVRFVELKGGVFYCQFSPTYNQVPLLGEHFSKRLNHQTWVIHDVERNLAVFYDTHDWYVNEFHGLEEYMLSSDEILYQTLWKTFHEHIAIEERKNPTLQRSFMPKKYWKYLIEMQ